MARPADARSTTLRAGLPGGVALWGGRAGERPLIVCTARMRRAPEPVKRGDWPAICPPAPHPCERATMGWLQFERGGGTLPPRFFPLP